MRNITQESFAECLENTARKAARPVEEVAAELVRGPLHGHCTVRELLEWHRKWRDRQHYAKRFQQDDEIPVDPAELEAQAGREVEAEAEGIRPFRPGEIAGGMLRMMDRRLLREEWRWKETAVSLRAGECGVEIREGPGREQTADGQVVEWVAYAVVTLYPNGAVCRVFAECGLRGRREPGFNKAAHGVLRLKRAVLVRGADNGGTTQAVGTLLLLYKGDAAGFQTHAGLAAATGHTRANGSAKARRMAEENVKTGGRATFRCIRRRETVGRKTPNNKKQA